MTGTYYLVHEYDPETGTYWTDDHPYPNFVEAEAQRTRAFMRNRDAYVTVETY